MMAGRETPGAVERTHLRIHVGGSEHASWREGGPEAVDVTLVVHSRDDAVRQVGITAKWQRQSRAVHRREEIPGTPSSESRLSEDSIR